MTTEQYVLMTGILTVLPTLLCYIHYSINDKKKRL